MRQAVVTGTPLQRAAPSRKDIVANSFFRRACNGDEGEKVATHMTAPSLFRLPSGNYD